MTMEALGVDFGDHSAFYGADEWNERGYFERSDVIDLNSMLLTGVPRTQGALQALWSQLSYLIHPSPDPVARREPRLRQELASLAGRLQETAVKDPRFCLTLEAWRPYVERVVVVVRHPMAVARSLQRRQRVPLRLGLRFWECHAEQLVKTINGDTLLIDFDVLCAETPGRTAEVSQLMSFLDLDIPLESALSCFEERFAQDLVHFDAGGEDLPRRTWVLWTRLQELRRAQVDYPGWSG